tara:strand:+ start:234 stop:335 length:102 start_codon:yes stop_codon:yes gene_type:complete
MSQSPFESESVHVFAAKLGHLKSSMPKAEKDVV